METSSQWECHSGSLAVQFVTNVAEIPTESYFCVQILNRHHLGSQRVQYVNGNQHIYTKRLYCSVW